MSAAWLWVRLDLRQRVRSLIVLGLVVGVTTAVVLTAVAGSRRGGTVVDRLLERTKPATIAVLPNQPGFDWHAVEGIDGVAALSQFALAPYVVDGVPPDAASFPFDAETMHSIESPIVLEGRLADVGRDDEVVVTHAFEGTYGKGVDDPVTIRLYTPEQADALASEEAESQEGVEPEGSVIEARIVGVVRSPWFSDYGDVSTGALVPSAGLLEQHRAELLGAQESAFLNALVRLDGGAAAVPAFRERLAEVSGRHDIEFFNLAEDASHVRDVTGFEADALLAFAAAAGIAALFLVGQSIVRFVAGAAAELDVLRAVGMRPRVLLALAAVGPTLAAVLGAAVGSAAAFVASSRFPVGTAAPLEPAPGRDADLLVLLGGVLVVIGLVVGGALLAAWLASRSYARVATQRTSRIAAIPARLGARPPVAIGTRFALERGTGPQSVPVLPALIGSIIGVMGIVGALTFADGIDDATSHPERFGRFAELEAFFGFNGEDFLPADDLVEALAEVDGVSSVNDDRSAVAEVGPVDVSTFTLDPVDAAPPIVMIDGVLPSAPDEVALAPTSADRIGVGVGDTFELTGAASTAEVRVTGLAFVPEGPHNEYDSGAWLTGEGSDRIVGGFKFHIADITLEEGADPSSVLARIDEEVGPAVGAADLTDVVSLRGPSSRSGELEKLQRLPLLLAAFLGVLAVTAVGHAVATAVRRRRRDLAVLRAIGFTRWQARSIALTQAVVLALVGVVFGVPLGLALGRSLWRSVAESTPVLLVSPMALVAVLLITPIAVGIAMLLAAWPSQRAASMRVGQVLRTE
jgi:ABC-type lipoprotein release transport system permease subunit